MQTGKIYQYVKDTYQLRSFLVVSQTMDLLLFWKQPSWPSEGPEPRASVIFSLSAKLIHEFKQCNSIHDIF